MTDIVGRLRQHQKWGGPPMFKDAADEIERLRKGIQDYLDGDYEPKITKYNKCPHGSYGYEICEACIDVHFQRVLAGPTLTAADAVAELSGTHLRSDR